MSFTEELHRWLKVARNLPRGAKESFDSNEDDIVKELKQCGYTVRRGHDDLLVGFAGYTLWVEVKNPEGLNKISDGQQHLLDTWRGAYIVARSSLEIREWFSAKIKKSSKAYA